MFQLILQQGVSGYTGCEDNAMSQGTPDTNSGADTDFSTRSFTNGNRKSTIRFDFSPLPAGATITLATLQLYYLGYAGNDPVGHNVYIYELLRTDWVEMQATWNIYKTGFSWTTAGASSNGNDYTSTNGVLTTIPAAAGWMSWTPTTIIQDAQANHSEITNLLLVDTSGVTDGGVASYYSSEYATTSLRPKLTIDYTETALKDSIREGFIPFNR